MFCWYLGGGYMFLKGKSFFLLLLFIGFFIIFGLLIKMFYSKDFKDVVVDQDQEMRFLKGLFIVGFFLFRIGENGILFGIYFGRLLENLNRNIGEKFVVVS